MAWTRAVDLNAWADRTEARYTFPDLIRRLISATCEKIDLLDFPSYEEVQRRGWDGVATVGTGNPFVPAGNSGWELGTGKDPRAKAESDYETRTKDPLSLDPKNTVFVFATPRSWHGKIEWADRQKAAQHWKDVRVSDSSDLAQWLELAPAVDAWLAIERGIKPHGVCDLAHHWKNLASLSHPELKPAVFLASRAKERELVTEWLAGAPAELAFEANSPTEVIDFFAACVTAFPDSERLRFETSALIVEEREAWRQLAVTQNRLVLVASPRLPLEGELVAEAVRHGHHVLVASPHLPGSQMSKGRLARVQRYDLERALEESDLQKEASRLARESGGSLTVLKRLLSTFQGTQPPSWSLSPEAQDLAPFILAGSWADQSAPDQAILGQLHDKQYAEVRALAERATGVEDPLLMQVLGYWSLVSREDSWHLLSPKLRREHIDRFVAAALTVLTELDPQYDLNPSERWMAAIHKKVTRYSPTLRHGMAETLAVMGAYRTLFTEDLNPTQHYDGVQALNPFDASTSLDA